MVRFSWFRPSYKGTLFLVVTMLMVPSPASMALTLFTPQLSPLLNMMVVLVESRSKSMNSVWANVVPPVAVELGLTRSLMYCAAAGASAKPLPASSTKLVYGTL